MDGMKRVVWPTLLSIMAGMLAPGCKQVEVIPALGNRLGALVERLHPPGSSWSVPTSNLLRHLGLEDMARHHPRDAFAEVEQGIPDGRPDPARLLALAELADRNARSTSPMATDEAMAWSRDAAVYAASCLSASGASTGADATWCARATYTTRGGAMPEAGPHRGSPERSGWPDRLASAGIVPATDVPEWMAMGFTSLEPAEDRIVTGLEPKGQRDGLGVPLIVHRGLDDAEAVAWKPFGPARATFAATAVIRPLGSASSWRGQPIEMVLFDPMRTEALDLGGRTVPMAADLTTPMSSRLSQGPMRNYEYLGVVDPGFYAERAGAYAVDPYQPGKIPVVLLYGLWTSPKAWVPMLDALRGDPALRAAYQFWVVLYPSGYSLPTAAPVGPSIAPRDPPATSTPRAPIPPSTGWSSWARARAARPAGCWSSRAAMPSGTRSSPGRSTRSTPPRPSAPSWPRRSSSSPSRTSGTSSS